jgi:hypothetical protein
MQCLKNNIPSACCFNGLSFEKVSVTRLNWMKDISIFINERNKMMKII